MNSRQESTSDNTRSGEIESSQSLLWRFQPFLFALASGLCFLFAFFPFGWSWVGWLAPIGVLCIVQQEKLPGKRPYLQIWLACFICWLGLFQCVRLPHWAGYIGWPLLAGFLCTYLFLFVVVTRQLVYRWKVPVLFAAPLVWVGLEYLQAHLFTGISLAMLSHTQSSYPLLIQVADIGGGYTISFFMLGIVCGTFIGTLGIVPGRLSFSIVKPGKMMAAAGLFQALALATILIGYGSMRLKEADQSQTTHPIRVGLIQGSIDTRFPSESEMQEYVQSFTEEYTRLSKLACEQNVDLVVWPESMFPVLDFYVDGKNGSEDSLTPSDRQKISDFSYAMSATAHLVTGAGSLETTGNRNVFRKQGTATPILAGANSSPVGRDRDFYNSAILISEEGVVQSRYGKMKLVLFGEFVPLGEVFPFLYNFFPIPPGLKAGKAPVGMRFRDYVFSPSICFESTYPHLIRSQCLELSKKGQKPDVLVNLTNDGWFFGSTALDLHFANNVIRTVENRTPMLVAANTGFSGQIDSAGRVLHKGPRRKSDVLIVNLLTSEQNSIYHQVGDWPAFSCFILVLLGILSLICAPFLSKKLQLSEQKNLLPKAD